MIAKYKKNAQLGIIIAILGAILLGIFRALNMNPTFNLLGYVVVGFWFWGCYNLAKGKGYSGWFTLLGLLSFIGLIILIFLPNKAKDS